MAGSRVIQNRGCLFAVVVPAFVHKAVHDFSGMGLVWKCCDPDCPVDLDHCKTQKGLPDLETPDDPGPKLHSKSKQTDTQGDSKPVRAVGTRESEGGGGAGDEGGWDRGPIRKGNVPGRKSLPSELPDGLLRVKATASPLC